MKTPAVVVVGLGLLSTLGKDLAANTVGLFGPRKTPKPPTLFSTDHEIAYPVYELDDDSWFLDRLPDGPTLTRAAGMTAAVALEAAQSAGLDQEAISRRRAGVVVGTTVGASILSDEFYVRWRKGEEPAPDFLAEHLRSNPAACAAGLIGATGMHQTIINACSSGADAIGVGLDLLRSGVCDLVFAGGVDELRRVVHSGFISLKIADADPCKPFDASRKGLNLGEGAAMLALETEESACRRGAPILGRVLGFGAALDAWHMTAPHPDGRGLKRAIRDALAEAGASPADIGFVNAHGTATPDNDATESAVLDELLPGVPFLSTKGLTGHTLGAAGAIEAVFTLLCLQRGLIPASAGFTEKDPALPGPGPVATPTPTLARMALSQSLAFGGSNAALVLGL